MANLGLADFLHQLEPLIKGKEVKVNSESWIYKGRRNHKITLIWSDESLNQTVNSTPIALQVVRTAN